MHTIEVSGKSTRIEVPDHWNEMTHDQVAYIFKMYELLVRGKISLEDFKLRVLFHFVPVAISTRRMAMRKFGALYDVAQSAMWLYGKLFDYILKVSDDRVELNYDSPVQFFPSLRGGMAPGTLLCGLSMGRFVDIFGMLLMLDERSDDFFVGLYPGIELKRLASWQKSWIVMWFKSCLVHIQSMPVLIDGREVDFSPVFGGGHSTNTVQRVAIDPWRRVMFSVAESNVFGSIDKLQDADLFDVLLYLLKIHDDGKNLKN